jgi:prepilin peptidase CpaA
MTPRVALILLVGIAAMAEDLRSRTISNWTTGGAVLAGLILHSAQRGWAGAGHALLGTAIGFGVFLIFYLLGGMGGGDVKLMAGFGALLGGSGPVFTAALMAAGAGGVMALGYLMVRALARRSKVWLGITAAEPAADGDKSADSIPYAPAITAGAWLALVAEM